MDKKIAYSFWTNTEDAEGFIGRINRGDGTYIRYGQKIEDVECEVVSSKLHQDVSFDFNNEKPHTVNFGFNNDDDDEKDKRLFE